MKIWKFLLVGTLTSVAVAASSFEESSSSLAKDIAPSLKGKTVAVLDFLDQQKNVRELGRVLADQYLRVDLSKLGVKTVTRSALDRALGEIKLSQAGLTDAINGGLGNKFKAADVIVTGSLSQIGDNYTASVEAIDVKTGSSLVSSRSTFPKIASVQTLWDNVLEASRTTNPPPGSQVISSTYSLPAEPLLKHEAYYAKVYLYGCFGTTTDDNVTCVFTYSTNSDDNLDISKYSKEGSFYFVDSFGKKYDSNNASWIVAGSSPKPSLTLYSGIPIRFDVKYSIPKAIQTLSIMQVFEARWRDVEISGR